MKMHKRSETSLRSNGSASRSRRLGRSLALPVLRTHIDGAFGRAKRELRLVDLTGWWARCDALVLATGSFKPSDEKESLAQQRLKYDATNAALEDKGTYDVVVGGGPAGMGAAIAAALATKHKTTPRGIYEKHIRELQKKLVEDGCRLMRKDGGMDE